MNIDYQHLTTFERGLIEALHNLAYTTKRPSFKTWLQVDIPEPPCSCSLFQQNRKKGTNVLHSFSSLIDSYLFTLALSLFEVKFF